MSRAVHNSEPIQVDAAVIGAGIAGLTAAALLTQRGYRVIVLERDIHPGGCAANFSQDGYSFAVGATVAMGLEPGGIVRQIYDRLGLEANYVSVSPAMRVHLPDRVVQVMTSHHEFQDELRRVFPGTTGEQRGRVRFWHEVRTLSSAMHYVSRRFPVMPFATLRDLMDTAKAAHPKLVPLLFNLHRTVADRLRAFGADDPAHKAFIDGQLLDAMQTTADDCVAANGAFALDIYRYGCQYKIGGLARIAEDLAGYIASRGSEVRYASRVKGILMDGAQVKGVATNRGEIHAPVVISAIPMENTSQLLGNAAYSKLPARANQQPEMWGAFTLYMGVDERCLPKDAGFYEQVTDFSDYHDGGNLLISISPAWDRSRAPEGKRAITVSTHVNAQTWMDLAQERGQYVGAKQRLEQRLLDQIERALPNIRSGIEVFMSGTPKTFRNFTLRAGGTVGGFPQNRKHANFRAPSHHTDVSGLFLAGDTIFPGQGVLGVTVSGFNAARSAARYLSQSYLHHVSIPKEATV